ncbi:hypothetical protein THAOC_17692, partial [Thalassiosira oceanica]
PVRPAPVDEARTRVVSRRRRRGRRGLGAVFVDDERVGEVVRHAGLFLGELADRGFRPVAAEPSCPRHALLLSVAVDVSNRRPEARRSLSSCEPAVLVRNRFRPSAQCGSIVGQCARTDLTLRCDPVLLLEVQLAERTISEKFYRASWYPSQLSTIQRRVVTGNFFLVVVESGEGRPLRLAHSLQAGEP